jgi:hypothetical protein
MSVLHVKSVTIANSTDTNIVRPSDWNSAHVQYFTLAGNTNNASTVSGTNVVISGGNNITLVGSSNSIGISAAGAGGGTATLWQPFNEGVNVAGQVGNAVLHIVPLPTPTPAALGELHIDRLCLPLILSNATNSTGTVSYSFSMGLYTRNVSTLSLAYSTSFSTTLNYSGTVNNNNVAGIRLMVIPWTTTFGDGRYYVAQWSRTSTSSQNCTFNQMLISQINSNFSGVYNVASNRSNQWPLGYGVYSTTFSTALPGSIHFSRIDGTGSLAARPPSFFMISGTA